MRWPRNSYILGNPERVAAPESGSALVAAGETAPMFEGSPTDVV